MFSCTIATGHLSERKPVPQYGVGQPCAGDSSNFANELTRQSDRFLGYARDTSEYRQGRHRAGKAAGLLAIEVSPDRSIQGGILSIYFRSIGFADNHWKALEAEIRAQLKNDAKIKDRTAYGEKYEIRGMVTGPTGQRAEIVTAWMILTGEEIPRIITAHPGG